MLTKNQLERKKKHFYFTSHEEEVWRQNVLTATTNLSFSCSERHKFLKNTKWPCSRIISPWSDSTNPQTKRPSSGSHTSDPWRVKTFDCEGKIACKINKSILSIGSEDIRANEGREDYHRTPYSIYDDSTCAAGRITSPGYRYLPVSRDTYGYSPRAIYQHQTVRPSKTFLWCVRQFLSISWSTRAHV
jgi:Myofilin